MAGTRPVNRRSGHQARVSIERKGDAQRPGSFHVDDTGEAAQSLVNRSHLDCHYPGKYRLPIEASTTDG